LPIYETRHGGRFFAVAQAPRSRRQAAAGKQALSENEERPRAQTGNSILEELDLGDPLMARNIQAAKRLEARDIPLLLTGESGTGKEFFARALHAASERADKPFVAVNCGSLPETLLESELFGSADGNEHHGRIAHASGGTLFLDDVGDLPSELQAQLLHLIEEREVLPRGCYSPLKVDIRLVCASKGHLQEKARRGEFREDLFYRLQGLVLSLPALRDRQDKRAVIHHIFSQEAAATPSVSLSEELIDLLSAYSWPGNIRQLRNVLRGMIALRSSERLDVTNLPGDYGMGQPVTDAHSGETGVATQSLNPLEKAERNALMREIDAHHGNISRVAAKLEIGRNTLYRKMRRLGIAFPNRQAART
jgi:transcriptional regulator of acetoin/glycerol metabolism